MNPIVYCSKCNASFHKYCYGIEKIPENDFYCDTCYEDYKYKKRSTNFIKKYTIVLFANFLISLLKRLIIIGFIYNVYTL